MDAKKAFEAYVDEYADKKNKELDENEQAEKAYRANIRGVWFEAITTKMRIWNRRSSRRSRAKTWLRRLM